MSTCTAADIGTISPSGRKTHVYTTASGVARAEVPDDHPKPLHAAIRALMFYLADEEWRAGEPLSAARARMGDCLKEMPPVRIGEGCERPSGLGTIIFEEVTRL